MDSSAADAAPLPESLAQLAGEGDRLDQGAQPGADAAAPAAAPAEIPTADFLAGMLAPAFDQLAPNWKVKPGEIRLLSVGWGAVLDHYFPGGVSNWGPWGVALGATVAVIGPRINTPPRLEDKPADASATPANA